MTVSEAKKVKIAIIVLFFLFIAAFGLYRSSDLIFGVKVRDVRIAGEPAEISAGTDKSTVEITGNARHATKLTLNGREISIDLEGNFLETIALLPGYNIVSIRAEDKFGYADEEHYHLILIGARS